ncbi:MAG: CpsD/CapB family tyrosine-protein kinase [Candidatus Methylomirabilota bacterium]
MGLFSKKSTQKRPAAGSRPGGGLVTLTDPKSPISEAYRTIRTNLQFVGVDQAKKAILVTSAAPGEGKSTTTANLGVSMAMGGLKVVLVDSDLRRPTLHKHFGLSNTVGLSSILADQAPLTQGLQATQLPSLSVLTSGPIPPNPAEMLASARMRELCEHLRSQSDLVIFDSPPVISVSDAMVLASLADGVVLVVRAGAFPSDVARNAKAQLESVKATFLGVVLNSVDLKRDGYYYRYYYQYYYGYGYNNDSKSGGD